MSVWHEDLYVTKQYDYIISKRITEYDMKDGGFNLIKYYKLLPPSSIEYLETLDKMTRKIQIGKYMRSDKEFNKSLTESFARMRGEFVKENGIEDSDILSIKKDALFIVAKKCSTLSYGNVTFVPKNVYTSWHHYSNGVEMYYNDKDRLIDIKGISDESLNRHKLLMDIFIRIYSLLERNDSDGLIRLMKKFSNDYKNRNLSYGYYREFNAMGMYSIKGDEDSMFKFYIPDIIDHSFDDYLDISYNYVTYILPIMQRFYYN